MRAYQQKRRNRTRLAVVPVSKLFDGEEGGRVPLELPQLFPPSTAKESTVRQEEIISRPEDSPY